MNEQNLTQEDIEADLRHVLKKLVICLHKNHKKNIYYLIREIVDRTIVEEAFNLPTNYKKKCLSEASRRLGINRITFRKIRSK